VDQADGRRAATGDEGVHRPQLAEAGARGPAGTGPADDAVASASAPRIHLLFFHEFGFSARPSRPGLHARFAKCDALWTLIGHGNGADCRTPQAQQAIDRVEAEGFADAARLCDALVCVAQKTRRAGFDGLYGVMVAVDAAVGGLSGARWREAVAGAEKRGLR
jgi:hypothetical protein